MAYILKKQRHYFADKGPSSPSYGFSSSHGCESCTIKNNECRRTDAFELWCWGRLLTVPWIARRSNQSCLFIGRTDVEAETPILWLLDVKN